MVGTNEAFRTTTYIATTPNTSYYFSTTQKSGKTGSQIYIAYYDNTETFISRDSYNSLEHKFTTPTNCYYMRAGVYTESQENIMLEYGENKTSYEPYGTEWYIEKNIGKVVLNGSENWGHDTLQTGLSYYSFFTGVVNTIIKKECPLLSDKLENKNNVYSTDTQGITCNWQGNIRLKILESSLTTETALKTWLSTNPITVYYQLATTQYTVITDNYLTTQLNNIQDIQLIENLCYVDWVGEEKPTMYLQYGTTDILHAYIITENNKRIRTDWGI